MDLKTVEKLMTVLTQDMGDKIPIQQVLTFLCVARAEEVGEELEVFEVGRRINLSSAAISRNLAAIGDWHRLQRPGLKLVTLKPMMSDRRRKIVHLTKKGRDVLNKLSKI